MLRCRFSVVNQRLSREALQGGEPQKKTTRAETIKWPIAVRAPRPAIAAFVLSGVCRRRMSFLSCRGPAACHFRVSQSRRAAASLSSLSLSCSASVSLCVAVEKPEKSTSAAAFSDVLALSISAFRSLYMLLPFLATSNTSTSRDTSNSEPPSLLFHQPT